MSSNRSLDKLSPTEPLDLPTGLSLHSRLKLLLTIHRADKSLTPPNVYQLKTSLLDYLKSTFSLVVPLQDLSVTRVKDLKKRKRDDAVGFGTLYFRDLGFLKKELSLKSGDGDDVVVEWRRRVVEKMNGMELNLEGVKFRLSVEVPSSEDFEGMRKEWEEVYAIGRRGPSRGERQEPDTIVLRGAPSRWFAEPRVSSKPSMLVSHTIFSAFGKIRNLDVAEDDDAGKNGEEDDGDIVSGLQCKIIVRFEKYRDFYNALKVLCGRSLQKQGSRLWADYEVAWDKDGFLRNARSQRDEKSRWMPSMGGGNYRSEAPRHQSRISRFDPDSTRAKRFKIIHCIHRLNAGLTNKTSTIEAPPAQR